MVLLEFSSYCSLFRKQQKNELHVDNAKLYSIQFHLTHWKWFEYQMDQINSHLASIKSNDDLYNKLY